ncbi:hypothetical protein GMRT_10370 [Giardia muris]|uniref:Thioredoxin n=1 Tax=Giardia muris TaxID=5742 RepID=A0A4Z1SZ86_GIAMU|nr:hypothetical protein GMRT_10370 [Giardia muris]|eukprot:TNJ30075.1 hypothetical protein GMRT_10370 [Giardia muris]
MTSLEFPTSTLVIALVSLVVMRIIIFFGMRASRGIEIVYDELDVTEPLKGALVCITSPKNCVWCVRLETGTWRDSSVKSTLERHDVHLYRVTVATGKQLCKQYDIPIKSGIPRTLIFDRDGRYVSDILGYIKPAALLRTLERYYGK